MATPQEKLAAALNDLRALQASGARVFKSDQLTRVNRERLVKEGFLEEVIKGWLISSDPAARPGDTTAWYSSFWEFCARYCDDRFGTNWCLTPEDSLLLHAERTAVPKQVIVSSPTANNKRLALAHGTSLFALRKKMPSADELVHRGGLRLYGIEAALVHATTTFFHANQIEAQVVLRSISDPSSLLKRLLEGGHTTIAGRLVGAFRRIDRPAIANEILSAMKAVGHVVRESDPFDEDVPLVAPTTKRPVAPFVDRLQTLWAMSREVVVHEFSSVQVIKNRAALLSRIDDVYELDAYHSLSIEGYVVTPDLVDRVARGAWNPARATKDRDDKNALAARGYWLAFQAVREAIASMVRDRSIADLRTAHRDWYRQLFAPHVAVGLLEAGTLAGYRTQPVYLRGSRHVPPRYEVVREAIPVLFDLIESEENAAVRAVLGHWLFGYIHPFPDGNGRVARFLMNALFVCGGYPWTIIRVEDRSRYLAALESASVDGNVVPFATFVADQVRQSNDVRMNKRR